MKVRIDIPPSKRRSYDILIDEIPQLTFDSNIAIITNDTVAPLHLDRVVKKIDAPGIATVIVKDGEEYKNLQTIETILDRLFEARLDRSSTLIALGGGVIGDMTGFSASIYQRGIDFVQIPTTLLSQVDASVGGKTGVNNRFGKNLIGSFYQPKGVYIDTNFLKTLPKREFNAGIAEIIKMAVMFDRDFFDFLKRHDISGDETALKEAIAKSVTIKADVVAQDELEKGIRSVLNYGHTFAHVIENETGYKCFLHGEAVAIGMVMANTLAQKLGLLGKEEAEEIRELLQFYELPVTYGIEDIDSFYDHFFLDKKTKKGNIAFILPDHIGTFKILKGIDEKIVKEALAQFRADE